MAAAVENRPPRRAQLWSWDLSLGFCFKPLSHCKQ